MKKLLLSVTLLFLTAACSQTDASPSAMMQGGAMCEKCPCCQKMMDGGTMKDGMMGDMMKDGKTQCSMMTADSKDAKKCSCCQKMMEGGNMQNSTTPVAKPAAKTTPVKTTDSVDHKAHHPAN